MRKISNELLKFQSVEGYFKSDQRILKLISLHNKWNYQELCYVMSGLNITSLIPDNSFHAVVTRFLKDDLRLAISERDLKIFTKLCEDLAHLNEVKFIVSRLLCAYAPDFFPIWNEKRVLIREWNEQLEIQSYTGLKHRFEVFKKENGCEHMNYFQLNKFLWICE